jgi:CTP:molybdopterin cytidylyltransferase MocA
MSDPLDQNIAAVILAAGEGKRFGGPKALARLGDITFLEAIVHNLREIAADIVVVGGASFDKVEKEAVRLGARAIFNPDWPKGQFTSLKTGLKAISDDAAAMVILVDHPLVEPETYRVLLAVFKNNPDNIMIPVTNGRRGHPLIIPSKFRSEILDAPDDSNLRDILKNHSADIVEVDIDDAGILRDIDTPRDLTEAARP